MITLLLALFIFITSGLMLRRLIRWAVFRVDD